MFVCVCQTETVDTKFRSTFAPTGLSITDTGHTHQSLDNILLRRPRVRQSDENSTNETKTVQKISHSLHFHRGAARHSVHLCLMRFISSLWLYQFVYPRGHFRLAINNPHPIPSNRKQKENDKRSILFRDTPFT